MAEAAVRMAAERRRRRQTGSAAPTLRVAAVQGQASSRATAWLRAGRRQPITEANVRATWPAAAKPPARLPSMLLELDK